jgi:aminopeptidase-like protein
MQTAIATNNIADADELLFQAPGREMYAFAKRLFPICRSLTGDGVRQTLSLIQKEMPDNLPALKIGEVPSGTQCFD